MSRPVLQVIVCSTRPGRVGLPIARWFYDIARGDGSFDVEFVDLLEVDLPIFNEPNEPAERDYTFEYTKRWSESVSRADAFVFVVPEYNHSFNAATKNALDYLYHEWRYKPAGLLGYGGGSMGTRALQQLKPVLLSLKMIHAGDVAVSLSSTPVVDDVFAGNDRLVRSATNVLAELARLVRALGPLRD
jgi:NAD(P)H-dependent FMN reductase